MRIAHLDCATGISGDMTLAALIDAGVDPKAIQSGVDSLGLEGVSVEVDTVIKFGFRTTYVRIEHPKQHAHRHLSDILAMIDKADSIAERPKQTAKQIFHAIGAAEARMHGTSIEQVHFHEVGAVDSIVDIVGAAIAFDVLGADRITCSPIPTGHGRIKIDHGICSIPAPATAELLKGIPLQNIPVEAELTTPTGAAIVKTLVDSFQNLPEMTIEEVGYGSGTMDLPGRANMLRVFVGQAIARPEMDVVTLLETNLDDVTGEVIGHTRRRLFDAGAMDVYTTPIQMKKDRPGIILSVLASQANVDALESILFEETSTLGIRRHVIHRSIRSRKAHSVETVFGTVKGKLAWRDGEAAGFTPEFDDCARIADERSVSLREVYRAAEAAWTRSPVDPSAKSESTSDIHSHDHSHDHDHDHDHHH